MKVDSPSASSSLIGFLVANLRPLTPADPAILAEYVLALLKKDKPTDELKKLCTDNLVEFLGHSTQSFINNLFQAIEGGSIVIPVDNIDTVKSSEPSAYPAAFVQSESRSLSSKNEKGLHCKKEQNNPMSSGPDTDPEDQEVSDDDDDRNHKHRKRDPRPIPLERQNQRQYIGKQRSRGNKNFENGELFQSSYSYLNANKREHNTLRRSYVPVPEFGQRNRINQSTWSESAPRFDLSTSLARPPGGRGRGRGMSSWSKHDSRFVPLGPLDLASHINSQGPNHSSMFVGANLPSAASTQNAPWCAFGFVPGMPNMCLEPLHPIGLQGTLHSSVGSQLNLAKPMQRCRDFEEQGFCLRGDMCPMEHGVNRIVVEDVQSLSQFNLPVSLPAPNTSGLQTGTGPSSQTTNGKSLPGKSTKVGVSDVGLNEHLHSSVPGLESDVYDPDQPLWNDNHPETSKGLLSLPPTNDDGVEPSWNVKSSENHDLKFLSRIENNEPPSSSCVTRLNPQVKRHFNSEAKLKMGSGVENIDSEIKEGNGCIGPNVHSTSSEGIVKEDINLKVVETGPNTHARRIHKGIRRNTAGTSQGKVRTLYVSKIPQDSNKKSSLLSHFVKFGTVVDIYIPLSSDKAFVQFSKREEAEAALTAPDAVMGNRFIKLFWANRDNAIDGKEVRPIATPVPVMPGKICAPSLKSLNPSTANISNKSVDVMPTAHVPPTGNTTKTTLARRKLEALELLKEELRKKHESLAEKRINFRNQLHKMEKEAVSLQKVEVMSEQHVFKKRKSDKDVEIPKTPKAEPMSCIMGTPKGCEKTVDTGISRDELAISNSNNDSAVPKLLPRGKEQSNNISVLSSKRFKLDNRPTGFRILPPLPADFSNVAAIKEHFSKFSDLSTVELEDIEDRSDSGDMTTTPKFSARIIFTTRCSAEKAFFCCKCWQGHNLQFAWLMPSAITKHDPRHVSLGPNLRVVQMDGNAPENGVSTSISSSGVSASSIIIDTKSEPVEITPKTNATCNGEQKDVDVVASFPKTVVETSLSTTTTTMSSHEAAPLSDVAIVDDSLVDTAR